MNSKRWYFQATFLMIFFQIIKIDSNKPTLCQFSSFRTTAHRKIEKVPMNKQASKDSAGGRHSLFPVNDMPIPFN